MKFADFLLALLKNYNEETEDTDRFDMQYSPKESHSLNVSNSN